MNHNCLGHFISSFQDKELIATIARISRRRILYFVSDDCAQWCRYKMLRLVVLFALVASAMGFMPSKGPVRRFGQVSGL